MLNWMLGIIPTIVVLGILVLVHEWGHFIACRLSGVRVEKFSIGFGPAIFTWKGKETDYILSLIPFGGYVKPAGDSAEDLKERSIKPDDYLAQGVVKRFFIIFSGAFMNYVLGFLLFIVVFFVGHPVVSSVIGGLVDGYPAQEAHLEVGDRVVEVKGKPVKTWVELTDIIQEGEGEKLDLAFERAGKRYTASLTPTVDEATTIFGETKCVARIGIYPSQDAYLIERFGFFESVGKASSTLLDFTATTYKAIFYLVTGKLSLRNLTGPVGIMAMTSRTARLGIIYLTQLTAILSISLAIFNLLPFPALDGGHILFLAVEALRKKPIRFETQERVTQAGFVLLIVLMVVVMYNDIVRLDLVNKVKNSSFVTKVQGLLNKG
ncbi:MAG: RIP metalloprotease RseP [Candidatus Omnitrophica bacterium]|nr:RIP metalloprotease RseP [Candidatus Omnitrophota bacterium]